jgi:fumarate reductase flavoprotein subunit
MKPKHDVLLVGGGGAGLRAAIAVAERNPRLATAVISKVYPMRSHTVSAEGGAAGVIGADDSLDEHFYDTVSGGDWLSDQDAVDAFVREAPQELMRLEHWGCPWSREPSGKVAVRPFGGMKKKRTWFAADKTGFHMLHTLFQTSLKYTSITRYDEWFVTKLLVDDGRVQGVVAIELMTGRIETITAKSVILCTGGCGRVFPFTTNAAIKTGDGMALAYRAGAPLKDMEFIQYHPTGLPFTGILITEAARAEGGFLINKDGYRYLQDYNLGKPEPKPVFRSMELGPRDRLSQAFVQEMHKGRTVTTPYGQVVHLDLRHLGEKVIDAKIPFVRELCLKYQNVDPVKELVPVRPVIHYMMGGVSTDVNGATPIEGLYAAGEVACVSINGANRLGSNSLPELLVFGARAGKAAAEYAMSHTDTTPAAIAQGKDEYTRLTREFAGKRGGQERIATLREDLQKTMEAGAGIYREASTLARAASHVRELQGRAQHVLIEDQSRTFTRSASRRWS